MDGWQTSRMMLDALTVACTRGQRHSKLRYCRSTRLLLCSAAATLLSSYLISPRPPPSNFVSTPRRLLSILSDLLVHTSFSVAVGPGYLLFQAKAGGALAGCWRQRPGPAYGHPHLERLDMGFVLACRFDLHKLLHLEPGFGGDYGPQGHRGYALS